MREKVFVARVPSYDDPDAIAAAVRRGLEFLEYTPPSRLAGMASWALAHAEVARSCYTRSEFLQGALRALLGRNERASIELIGGSGTSAPASAVARRAAGTSVVFERRGAYELERIFPGRVRIRPADAARLRRYGLSVGPLLEPGERRAIEAWRALGWGGRGVSLPWALRRLVRNLGGADSFEAASIPRLAERKRERAALLERRDATRAKTVWLPSVPAAAPASPPPTPPMVAIAAMETKQDIAAPRDADLEVLAARPTTGMPAVADPNEATRKLLREVVAPSEAKPADPFEATGVLLLPAARESAAGARPADPHEVTGRVDPCAAPVPVAQADPASETTRLAAGEVEKAIVATRGRDDLDALPPPKAGKGKGKGGSKTRGAAKAKRKR